MIIKLTTIENEDLYLDLNKIVCSFQNKKNITVIQIETVSEPVEFQVKETVGEIFKKIIENKENLKNFNFFLNN